MNEITTITRQQIADEMQISEIWYHGRQTEPDFLGRIFDLKNLSSRDGRYTNAYDDIYQHTVNNFDWDNNWIYSDPRINLFHCEDSLYLKFLSNSLHPTVRTDQKELEKLYAIYNKSLNVDGFEILKIDEISGKPIFSGSRIIIGQKHLSAKRVEIKKYLNTAYVDNKITIMNDVVYKDTDLAIGTAKELLETTCKSILKQRGKPINPKWTLPQLLKETTAMLDFTPKEAQHPQKAENSIRQILSGIGIIVHGAAELRNEYGTGHGKEANFKGLETRFAKLFVGVVSEIAILYLATNGEAAELVEI
jgi:hypothetical protein